MARHIKTVDCFQTCRCVGNLETLSSSCSGSNSDVVTITSSTAKTLFRFVPLKGEEGTYRIIVKNRKGGCNRFLSAFEDCSTTTVGLAKEDYREGLQRWVFSRVQPENTPAPVTPAPVTPTPQPSINPPPEPPTPQKPTIKSAYATSSTSGKVTVGFLGGIESEADCIVNLSPGGKNKNVAVSPQDNEISVEFMDLNPATKYTATAVLRPKNGNANSPTSEPASFTTPGIPYISNPGSDTICDGRGEVLSGDGQCICNGDDVDYGPFVPRSIGGCKCTDGLVDLGYGPCTCRNPSMKTSEGLCKCPVMYSLCDTDTVCCPCTQYVPVADLTLSDIRPGETRYLGGGSYGGQGAVTIDSKGDLIASTDWSTVDDNGNPITKGYVWSRNGSVWIDTIIDLGNPKGGNLNANAVATNGDGTLLLLADYDWSSDDRVRRDGAALLFEKVDDNWVFKQQFNGDDYNLEFGFSVSMDKAGNVIVIADYVAKYPGYQDPESMERGTLYVYRKRGDRYVSEANITASDWDPDTEEGDFFGDGYISGDGRVIIAREVYNKPGKVYVIKYTGTGWEEVQILRGSQTPSNKQFGRSLNINGDGSVVVAGDPYTNNGQVYVFRYNGTLWEEEDVLIGGNTASIGSTFGNTVDINDAGDVIVVGDYNADTDGRVYVFRYLDDAWTEVQMLQGSTNFDNTLGKFGWKVVINDAGDVIGVNDYQEHVYVFQNFCE